MGKGAQHHRSQSNNSALRILGKAHPASYSANEALQLDLKKKDVKETKQNEMETKCWQIKIALDLYLLDF